jgi:hypothetical protein
LPFLLFTALTPPIAVFIKVEPAFEKYLFGSGSRSIRAPDEAFRVRTQSTGSILMNTAIDE